MGAHRHLIRLAAAAAILGLGAACHGASPGTGYVPASASAVSLPQASDSGPVADHKKGDIDSTCGTKLHIVLLGFVDCKFKEKGYGGLFRIFNRTKGIVTITPSSGTKATTFTVIGAVLGHGEFLVKDGKGNHLALRVKVTL